MSVRLSGWTGRRRWAQAWPALALAVVVMLPPQAAAQSKTGTTLGQFLLIEPSARIAALGNAGGAIESGLEGAYYNPAAAGRIQRRALEFAHLDWFAGIRYDYVAAALPLGGWGTGFASVTSLNSGEIDVRTVNQPLGTGERFSVSDLAIGVGFGRAVTERFSAGVQFKYLQETVWHSTASTVTFDVGTIYRIRPGGLHIGSSLSNFGTAAGFSGRDLRITYDGDPTRNGDNGSLPGERFVQDYPVPIMFRVGVGVPWRPDPEWTVWTVAEAIHPNDNSESVSAGLEATFHDLVAARIGYQSLFKEDSEEGLTLGTGLKGRLESWDYRIDYAWADHGRLGGVHRLALGLLY